MQLRIDASGPSISLIVPCHSTERYDDLVRLVGSAESQISPIDEVIFVVQQSVDLNGRLRTLLRTSALCRMETLFLAGKPGVARARNAGVERAKSDIIAFTDDDAELAPDWALQTRRAYREHPQMVGLAGSILPLWDSPAMDWFPRELYWMLSCTYWDTSMAIPVRNGYGANMSFRRSAFDDRRFDESLGVGAWATGAWRGMGGEEPELCLRLQRETGMKILYVPEVRVWHRVRPYRLAARTIASRAYWEGRFKAMLERMTGAGEDVLGTEHAVLRMVADNSIARLGMLRSHPLLALKQQATVTLAVTAVLCGYAEGRLRGTLDHGSGREER